LCHEKNHLLPNSWHKQTETLHLEHFWRGWNWVSPNSSGTHLNCQQKLSEYGWEISVRQLLLLFETIWLSTGKWVEILGPFLERLKVNAGEKIWKKCRFADDDDSEEDLVVWHVRKILDGPKSRSGKFWKNNQLFGRIWIGWIIFLNESCAIVFI